MPKVQMGEVTGIHRKIDELSSTMQRKIGKVGDEVSYMRGKLDATLPHLARTTEVESMILNHKNQCRRSIMPPKTNGELAKQIAKIGGLIGALVAAIWTLIEVLSGKPAPVEEKPEKPIPAETTEADPTSVDF